MNELQKLVNDYQMKDKNKLVALLLSSYDWVVKMWEEYQPKDELFKFGSLDNNGDGSVLTIYKTVAEMSDAEKRSQVYLFVINQLL